MLPKSHLFQLVFCLYYLPIGFPVEPYHTHRYFKTLINMHFCSKVLQIFEKTYKLLLSLS